MKIILEISRKVKADGWIEPIGDDFMDQIELALRYGGHLNQNLCNEIEIKFPEEVKSIKLKEVSKY